MCLRPWEDRIGGGGSLSGPPTPLPPPLQRLESQRPLPSSLALQAAVRPVLPLENSARRLHRFSLLTGTDVAYMALSRVPFCLDAAILRLRDNIGPAILMPLSKAGNCYPLAFVSKIKSYLFKPLELAFLILLAEHNSSCKQPSAGIRIFMAERSVLFGLSGQKYSHKS